MRPSRIIYLTRVPRRAHPAFTMVEAVVCTLVVGVMLVAALQMVGVSVRARQVNAQLSQDNALAVGLVSEILQARYAEQVEEVSVEGPEIQFDSSMTSGTGVTIVVDGSKGQGQYFKPTLPADAVGWSVTRVLISAQSMDATTGINQVQMRRGDADGLPAAAVLQQVTLLESELTPALAWKEIAFSAVNNLAPGEGVCLLITGDRPGAMRVELIAPALNPPGNGKLLSGDSGASWSLNTGKAIRFDAYGRVTTSDSNPTTFGLETPESSTSRADYDDVDDYDDWSASPPEDRDGNALSGYDGWTRAVAVEYVAPDDPNGASVGSDSGLKRVTVTVTDPEGRESAIVGFRAKVGVYEQEITLTKTYTSWIGLSMQIEGDVPVFTGTDLLNEPVTAAN